MRGNAGGYTPLIQLIHEVGRAWDSGATVAALAMVYVGIDTMAWLACPAKQQRQTGADFTRWVDRYLKADPASDYQYEGVDVYAARCALLHSYGSRAHAHNAARPPRQFGYADNGPHRKDDAARFVLISVATLIRDFGSALEAFLRDVKNDRALKERVDSRVTGLLLTSLLASKECD